MKTLRNAASARTAPYAAALVACCGWGGAGRAAEIVVPTQMPLSVALAVALPGDTVIILPSGSPYQTFPGLAFSNKHLTIRGSTGNPADVVLDGAGLDRVLTITATGTTGIGTVIQGLTIQNGRGPTATESSGGGIYLSNVGVTIRNCIIRNNVVPAPEGNGAGLYATASNLVIQDTRFENNTVTGADGDGGGAYLNAGTALFQDCQFTGNRATTVLNNEASGGGGLLVDNGTFQFTRCILVDNQAEVGGAIQNGTAGTLTMDACRIQGNTARYGAGVYIPAAATRATIRNTLLVGNTSTLNDSAIRADKTTALINCTIAGNTAANYVIGSVAVDRRVVTVDNCIIWGNTVAGPMVPITLPTNAPIIRRCLVQSAYTVANGSGNNTVADPSFVNAGARDYHLLPGSRAIDAGDTGLYAGPLADFENGSRGVEVPQVPDTGVAITGPVIDIGAFEFQMQAGPACYANCDQSTTPPVLNVNDFVCFQARFAAGCP